MAERRKQVDLGGKRMATTAYLTLISDNRNRLISQQGIFVS